MSMTLSDIYLSEKEHGQKLFQDIQSANGLKKWVCAKNEDIQKKQNKSKQTKTVMTP